MDRNRPRMTAVCLERISENVDTTLVFLCERNRICLPTSPNPFNAMIQLISLFCKTYSGQDHTALKGACSQFSLLAISKD